MLFSYILEAFYCSIEFYQKIKVFLCVLKWRVSWAASRLSDGLKITTRIAKILINLLRN